MRWILLCLALTACGRPLTESERAFLGETLPQLQVDRVRIVENPLVGLRSYTRPTRPQTTCRERIFPPPTAPTVQTSTAGMVLFNHVWVAPGYHLQDYVAEYPARMNLVAAMYFAHEMTHVWQWQQRQRTGYHPLRGASEHWVSDDPYLFDPNEENRDFLDYGYEQQASLVEEYLCCQALDPSGVRTGRLEAILQPYLDLTPMRARISEPDVLIPWDGAVTQGICS